MVLTQTNLQLVSAVPQLIKASFGLQTLFLAALLPFKKTPMVHGITGSSNKYSVRGREGGPRSVGVHSRVDGP